MSDKKIDIILTDSRRTVLHGYVTPEIYEYLITTDLTVDGWKGVFSIYNVCQIINWRNENGFTGLLALGPITNEKGGCLLSVRAPEMRLRGADLTGAHPLSDAAKKEFANWKRP
jgi:hypothetical protein